MWVLLFLCSLALVCVEIVLLLCRNQSIDTTAVVLHLKKVNKCLFFIYIPFLKFLFVRPGSNRGPGKLGDGRMGRDWFKCAGIRALKTMAQTAVASIGTSALISDINWLAVLSASVVAGVLSLLTSVAGLPEVD